MATRPKRLQPATHYGALVGQVLAWLREQEGWTQGEMADRVGVSHPVWSRIERGEASLASARLHAAAQVLRTTPSDIYRLADEVEADAKSQGVRVARERPSEWLVAGAIFLGAAAVAALIASLLEEE